MIDTSVSVAGFVAAVLVTSSVSAAAAQTARPSAAPPTGVCQCAVRPAQLLDQVDHIFIGELVEVKGDEDGVATIRVRENFKGALTGVVEVRDAVPTQCSWSVFEMAVPGQYMVFANLDEGELVTPRFCPQTQPLSGWQGRLAEFRAYARAHRAGKGSTAAKAPPASTTPSPKTGS